MLAHVSMTWQTGEALVYKGQSIMAVLALYTCKLEKIELITVVDDVHITILY